MTADSLKSALEAKCAICGAKPGHECVSPDGTPLNQGARKAVVHDYRRTA